MNNASFDFPESLPKLKENKKFLRRCEKRQQKRKEEEEKVFATIHGRKALKKAAKKEGSSTPKRKERRPQTVVARAPTGKETLLKRKAKELVKQKREKAKKKRAPTSSLKKIDIKSKEADQATEESMQNSLLKRSIQGTSHDSMDPFLASSLYPASQIEAASNTLESSEEVLEKAHRYFEKLHERERRINKAAAQQLKKMKEINRRGGDKDGFRYVLPKNTKQFIREMMLQENSSQEILDTESLPSTFGSGKESTEHDDKPVRRSKKRRGTFSNFYQFQVSKRWTKNAENFLFRERVDKSLFENKKRQRSIKKL